MVSIIDTDTDTYTVSIPILLKVSIIDTYTDTDTISIPLLLGQDKVSIVNINTDFASNFLYLNENKTECSVWPQRS